MNERELAFKGDQSVLNSLQDIKISCDSLLKISDKPSKYNVHYLIIEALNLQ